MPGETKRSGARPAGQHATRRGSRSKARKRALDILFESEARAEDPLDVLRRRVAGSDAPPVSDFAATLVEGVVEQRDLLDLGGLGVRGGLHRHRDGDVEPLGGEQVDATVRFCLGDGDVESRVVVVELAGTVRA